VAEGFVSWFDPRRGTGGIVADDGTEIAVRASAIAGGGRQSLLPGDRVVFVLSLGPDGGMASEVYVP
jgi:cold shock CspA family protein